MSSSEDFEKELETQVRERLAIMEEPGYEFPKALDRLDWSLIIAIPVVSLVLLVLGEFL